MPGKEINHLLSTIKYNPPFNSSIIKNENDKEDVIETTTAANNNEATIMTTTNSPRGKQLIDMISKRKDNQHLTTNSNNNSLNKNEGHDNKEQEEETKTQKPSSPGPVKKHPVFADLREAERTILEMVNIASSTAKELSNLASLNNNNNSFNTTTTKSLKNNNQQRLLLSNENIKRNGIEYLNKLQRIHSILSPHSKLVIPYSITNHNKIDPNDHELKDNVNGTITGAPEEGTPQITSSLSKKQQLLNNNMYASRIEMRLAIERKSVMKEFLILEKEEERIMKKKKEKKYADCDVGNGNDSLKASSLKRKMI